MSYFLVAPNGTKVPLPVQPLRFGSDASADVRLSPKLGLAPMHFMLQPNGIGFTLETLTPGFPVYVNEEVTANKDLENGDSIRAGSFCVKYETEQTINYLVPPPEQRPMSFGSLPTLPRHPQPPLVASPSPEDRAEEPPADPTRPEPPAHLDLLESPPPLPLTPSSAFFTDLPEPKSAPASPVAPLEARIPLLEAPAPPGLDAASSMRSWVQRAQQAAPVTEPREFRLLNSMPLAGNDNASAPRPVTALPPARVGGLAATRDALPIPVLEQAKGRWSARSLSAKLAILGAAAASVFTFLMWAALEGCRPAWGDFSLVPLLKIFCYLIGTAGIGWASGSLIVLVDRNRHPMQPMFVGTAVMGAAALASVVLALPMAAPSADGVTRLVHQIKNVQTVLVSGFDWGMVAEKASEPWALLGIVVATLAAYMRSHREAR